MRFGVIADDLTGGTDTGVQFSSRGLRTLVMTGPPRAAGSGERPYPEDVEAAAATADVLVMNSGARDSDVVEAAELTRRCAHYLQEVGCGGLYVKIDSALRGHVGAYVRAAALVWKGRDVVVAPAYPAQGRTTVHGVQLVRGMPVSQSESGTDLKNPATEAHIPTLLKASGISGATVHNALTDEDLRGIAKGVGSDLTEQVLVGSAGLAAHVAELIAGQRTPARSPSGGGSRADRVGASRGVLVINGSMKSASAKQVLALVERGVREVQVPVSRLAEGNVVAAVDLVIGELSAGRHAVVTVGEEPGTIPATDPRTVAAALGQVTAGALTALSVSGGEGENDPPRTAGIVVSGGDTSAAVCAALNVTALWTEHEVLPGVPLAVAVTGPNAGLPLVTKSGGFGDELALVKATSALLKQGWSDSDA